MNLIYISPAFPPNFQAFCHGLANRGVNVLGIGEDYYDNLSEDLKSSLTEYYRVDNLEDYEQVYRAAAWFAHRWGRIERVESHNEHWMMHEARLREDFNIQGPKTEQTLKIKRKSEMKKIFNSCKVPVVAGEIIKDRLHLEKFIGQHGYPVFAKPDIGVGAMAAFKIQNETDVDNFFKTRPGGDYFVEPFIDGQLITFDGICDQDGEIRFYSSLYSVNGAFDLVAYKEDLSFYLVRDIPPEAIKIGKKVVKKFDIRAKFFHLEFLKDRNTNKFYVLEMNCRPPGGYTVDLMNFASDINVYQGWADIVTDNSFHYEIERKYYAAHISRKWDKRYLHSHDEIMQKYHDKIVMNTDVPVVFAEVMGDFAYIVRAQDRQEIYDMISFIQAKD
jgi:biotin carboxylase